MANLAITFEYQEVLLEKDSHSFSFFGWEC